MDKKLNEIHENLIPTKLTIIRYNAKSYNTIKHKYIPYNFPTFSAVNNVRNDGSKSSYVLTQIGY